MIVSEVIEELKKIPGHIPVCAVLGSVFLCDEEGEHIISLDICDSLEVTDLRWEGNHVLLWADGMHR